MQYSTIKEHSKTVELKKTSFSHSHKYVAFGVDLYNDETIRFMVRDIQ